MSRSNARTLRKVVPIAQRREAGGITVALSALELYEGGEGLLRYLISHDPKEAFEYGGPEPEMEIRDGSGRRYGWGSRATAAEEAKRRAPWRCSTYRTPGASR